MSCPCILSRLYHGRVSANVVASASCVALVHLTIRATLEAILDHGVPGPHEDGPPGEPYPPSPMCPPSPLVLWGSPMEPSCQDKPCRPPPWWPQMPPSCWVRGQGSAGHGHWGRPAGGSSAVERLGRGKDLVAKKAFWSDLGYLCRGQSRGFHSGDKSVFFSPSCTAVQPRPCHGDAELWSPGVKRKVNPRGLALSSALFFFPPNLGGRSLIPGYPQAQPFPERRTPRAVPALPRPSPRSARLQRGAAFKAPSPRVDSVVSVSSCSMVIL